MVMIGKKELVIASTLLLLLGAACKPNKDGSATASGDDKKATTTDEVTTSIPNVTITPSFDRSQSTGLFNVQNMSVQDSTLTLIVNYSGGCKEHEFELVSDGNYAKSLPPQLTLFLKHEDNDDRCRMMVMDTLQFNVAPVKYPRGEELILRLNNTKQTVRYRY